MTVIGITGPTGSGKTTALRVLEERGFRVLDCDAVYHALLAESEGLRRELTQRFGAVFVNGVLDRKKLGSAVWGDEQALADLNEITHRHILNRLREELAKAEAEGLPGAAIDAIALLESGAGELCDVNVAIVAPPEVRLKRIMARDNISEDYAAARIRAQKSGEWFEANCDHTVYNDSTEEAFRQKAEALFDTVLGNQ